MVLAEDGTVKEALMYQPYGTVSNVESIGATSTDPLRQKFTTKELDEEGVLADEAKLDFKMKIEVPSLTDYAAIFRQRFTSGVTDEIALSGRGSPSTGYHLIGSTSSTGDGDTVEWVELRIVNYATSEEYVYDLSGLAWAFENGYLKTYTLDRSLAEIQAAISTSTNLFVESRSYLGNSRMNLSYFGARYLDHDLGMWLGTDPADQYWNTFSYCGGDPVNLTDPDGAFVPWGMIGAFAGMAIGGYAGGVAGNNGEPNPTKWENDQAWMIGAVAGFAAGGGIGYAGGMAASGQLAALGTSLRTGLDYNLAMSAYQIANASSNISGVPQLVLNRLGYQGAPRNLPNGVDAVTGADAGISDLEKTALWFWERFDPLDAMGGGIKIIGAANEIAKGSKIVKVISKVWPRHHPFPKYLGGAVNQTLKKIPKKLHYRFHSALDKFKGGKYSRNDGVTNVPIDEVIKDLREFYKNAEGGIFKKYLPDLEQAILESQ
jgi:RHS repeat-associated protein